MKKAGVLDKISIEGLRCDTVLGIFPEERKQLRTVLVDIFCFTDIERAAQTDDIRETVDYGRVAHYVSRSVRESSFHLVESLAEFIAKTVLEFPVVQQVVVRVTKPAAIPDCASVCVEIRRRK